MVGKMVDRTEKPVSEDRGDDPRRQRVVDLLLGERPGHRSQASISDHPLWQSRGRCDLGDHGLVGRLLGLCHVALHYRGGFLASPERRVGEAHRWERIEHVKGGVDNPGQGVMLDRRHQPDHALRLFDEDQPRFSPLASPSFVCVEGELFLGVQVRRAGPAGQDQDGLRIHLAGPANAHLRAWHACHLVQRRRQNLSDLPQRIPNLPGQRWRNGGGLANDLRTHDLRVRAFCGYAPRAHQETRPVVHSRHSRHPLRIGPLFLF